jgi:hypothetical protein
MFAFQLHNLQRYMTVAALKPRCKASGLKQGGKKVGLCTLNQVDP